MFASRGNSSVAELKVSEGLETCKLYIPKVVTSIGSKRTVDTSDSVVGSYRPPLSLAEAQKKLAGVFDLSTF